jgi:4'-phosphopantetheinyl transferase EntD
VIEELVPQTVRCRAAYGDELDHAPMHPLEVAAVVRAVAKRKAEYAAGRACARAALVALGVAPGPVLRDPEGRAPVWPEGVVGSITHCDGYRAAAVAHQGDVLTLGIDAEPHGPLPDGVLDTILSTDTERRALAELAARTPRVHGDRLLFSAKETVYKAWYPFHRSMLDFTEAELTFTLDADEDGARDGTGGRGDSKGPATGGGSGTYTARLLIPGPLLADGVGPEVFHGRWIARNGLVVTAIAVPNDQCGRDMRGEPRRVR